MNYKDIHGIYPGSTMWRTPSPGSDKPDPSNPIWGYNFKWDYKTPYKYSPYWVRKFHPTLEDSSNRICTGIEISQEALDRISKTDENLKEYIQASSPQVMKLPNTVEEMLETSAQVVKNIFEAQNLPYLGRLDTNSTSLYHTYFPKVDGYFAETTSTDPTEGNPLWYFVYFQAVQRMHDYDVSLMIFTFKG